MTNELQETLLSTIFAKAQKDCLFQPLYSQICRDLLVCEPVCMRSILEKQFQQDYDEKRRENLISFVGELGLKNLLHESVILGIFEQLF